MKQMGNRTTGMKSQIQNTVPPSATCTPNSIVRLTSA